jgi:ribosomal protein S18 acetylase RimI-like enzyme
VTDASGVTIRRLALADVEPASELLSRAFFHDPGALIVEPDDELRGPTIRALFAPVVRWAIPFGHVSGAFDPGGSMLGVATFVPPGHDTPTDDELDAAGLPEAIAGVPAAARRMATMTEFLEAQHVRGINGPHWRLDFYGVEPAAQGAGVGSRLIATGHDAADAAGERVWLETFTIENVRFYERRGYRVVVESIVPGTRYRLWGLVRDPQPIT